MPFAAVISFRAVRRVIYLPWPADIDAALELRCCCRPAAYFAITSLRFVAFRYAMMLLMPLLMPLLVLRQRAAAS